MASTRRSLLELLLIAVMVLLLLYVGRSVLIPLFYSLLVALVLYPLVAKLERKGLPRWLAITCGLALVAVLAGALLLILIQQFNSFLARLPEFVHATGNSPINLIGDLFAWLEAMALEHHDQWWGPLLTSLPGKITPLLGPFFVSLFGMAFNLFIIPVFTALILYHRGRWVSVLAELAGPEWALRLPSLLSASSRTMRASSPAWSRST